MTKIDIAILTLNEELYIEDCLKSVMEFEIPSDISINIFIIDGGSSDKTLDVVKEYSKRYSNIRLLKNEKKIQSSGMNLIIDHGDGDFILRLDAHSVFDKKYLAHCHNTAIRTEADNVGGVLNTYPGSDKYGAMMVQAISSHPFGVGDSSFRIGSNEGPADTVPFGFFRRSIFNKIGKFDERLLRAQDYEMNSRIIHHGGKIWLNPEIKADYFNQPSLTSFFKKIFFLEAPYNAYMWHFAPYTFTLRHSITALFSTGVIGGVILSFFSNIVMYIFLSVMLLYCFLALASSIQLALRFKKVIHLVTMPITFFMFHFLHGLGVLVGLTRILIGRIPKVSE